MSGSSSIAKGPRQSEVFWPNRTTPIVARVKPSFTTALELLYIINVILVRQ